MRGSVVCRLFMPSRLDLLVCISGVVLLIFSSSLPLSKCKFRVWYPADLGVTGEPLLSPKTSWINVDEDGIAAGPLKVRCGEGWGSADFAVGDWVKLTSSEARGFDVEIDSAPLRCTKVGAPLSVDKADDCSFIVVVVIQVQSAVEDSPVRDSQYLWNENSS